MSLRPYLVVGAGVLNVRRVKNVPLKIRMRVQNVFFQWGPLPPSVYLDRH